MSPLSEIEAKIQAVAFSDTVKHWLAEYSKVSSARGEFLWKWCHVAAQHVTLPCVPEDQLQTLTDTKMLHLIFLCLVDDLVDERKDAAMFGAVQDMVAGRGFSSVGFSNEDWRYFVLAREAWHELSSRHKGFARHREFRDDLAFDYAQVFQSLWHALRVNLQPSRINLCEAEAYQPHNMAMIYMGTLDLSASPEFDMTDVGAAREVFWHGQVLGRIGNTLATWQRELKSDDFSSVFFAHVKDLGLALPPDPALVQSKAFVNRIEDRLSFTWKLSYDAMYRAVKKVGSIDLLPYFEACADLTELHKIGKGRM